MSEKKINKTDLWWKNNWNHFINDLPFTEYPYSKRNWGNKLHSLCSFYGKLKPSITHHLIKAFTSEGDRVFDCFSGSGTIPFEAGLLGRINFGMDINPLSVVLSRGKVGNPNKLNCKNIIEGLRLYIENTKVDKIKLEKAENFGFNKKLKEYYHPKNMREIMLARDYFSFYEMSLRDSSYYLVLGCMLHILHGNRPYALSRRSHPITPYAPTGKFEYKNIIEKLLDKVVRSLDCLKGGSFIEGKIFHQDVLKKWPSDIENLNAIITSPPFFDSTRYHMINWIRNWFLGWEETDFQSEKDSFIDEKQKKSFDIYKKILEQSKDRLASGGLIVFHLGKSKKKDMGKAILPIAKKIFKKTELFSEDVSHIDKHGIRDKGTVSKHQYLIMY